MGITFTKEEIDAEEKRPKRKVAVLIGYSGTGYKGMQISATEKTIEGDLFHAFVKAGAISKANADDPKKASLVRCARTDKGVHAAGNMISLKLIVEDENIVERINEQLSDQIRVWGIERTIGSFSCYQVCDSRWYEYLIPSHAFLPPHPSSWLAKKLEEFAEDDSGSREEYDSRQAEVKDFWAKVDEEEIKPILDKIDEDIKFDVIKALNGEDEANAKAVKSVADVEQPVKVGSSLSGTNEEVPAEQEKTEEAAIIINEPSLLQQDNTNTDTPTQVTHESPEAEPRIIVDTEEKDRQLRLRAATKELRIAYSNAKRRYRIPQERIDRIQSALTQFVGTSNYHNYTILKTYKDPSAKRHIKSFLVNPTPILIGDGPNDDQKTEWLSLKIHGQSFMMHQIRKMVGMVALLVRCGSDLDTLKHSLGSERYSIPKVPGLGLLLERPVFDSYNKLQAPKHGRPTLEFSKYEKEMEAFKQRQIYRRIFGEEERNDEFGRFFNHIDNFKEPHFLYVTSRGLEATKGAEKKVVFEESDGEAAEGGEG
jgi:tRNA pseudouridine38-40 synthase